MAKHTSLAIGGPADLLVEPEDADSLTSAVRFARERGLAVTVVGAGTNVLVSDSGIRGLVIRVTERIGGIGHDGCHWWAGGGELFRRLAVSSAEHGYSGLEFGAGIPGTVAGAVIVNAGAHGQSTFECLDWIEAVDVDGTLLRIPSGQLSAGYRWTSIEGLGAILTRAAFVLKPADTGQLRAAIADQLRRRRQRHPLGTANAGSFFKNPSGDMPAGRLIDEAGLKGRRRGKAVVSPMHGNFIINEGGASAADVIALAEEVREQVFSRFQITLEFEVRLLGFEESVTG